MSLRWVSTLSALSLACATAARPAPEPAPSSSGPTTSRMFLPVFRSSPPTEPWLDLGPIVVRHGRNDAEVTSELIAQAEAIGASGFIVEGRGEELFSRPIYPTLVGPANSGSGASQAVFYAVLAGIFTVAQRDEPTKPSPGAVTSLRAFRLAGESPPRGPLDGPEVQGLPPAVRDALAGAQDLRQQLSELEAALTAQKIDVEHFDRAREELCARR